MAGINDAVEREKVEVKAEDKKMTRRDIEDEDEDDFIENYSKQLQRTSQQRAMPTWQKETGAGYDSDEEVYAAAKAMDLQQNFVSEEDAERMAANHRKEIVPLPTPDHSSIDYLEFEKCFYTEHEDIEKLTPAQVNQLRRELDMRVTGPDVPKPCVSFAHFGFDEQLLDTIGKAGYTTPTGIQQQSVPAALAGRDLISIAKTGSGKTAAFLWPMLVHIMDQPELEKSGGPIGLILAPTRELVAQIYAEAKKFAKCYNLRVAVAYGGASKMEQFKELRAGVEILVATPGRLIDLVKMKATNLRRVTFLVLDEADRMFDLGFEPQVRSICNNIRPDRQTLLFSATFKPKVEYLAREVTSDPVRITVGTIGQANEDVTQQVHILPDDSFKWDWVVSRLLGFSVEGSVLVFVARMGAVDILTQNLRDTGYDCGALHGDMPQFERDRVLRDFKKNKFSILIATDVAARGLDIKSVRTVINYDVARDIDSHVHRIGRTGRAGEKGTAYTLITSKEDKFAGDLVRNLEASNQPVPPELLSLAMQNRRFRDARRFGGGGGGRRGRGRGRGHGMARAGIGSSGFVAPPQSSAEAAARSHRPPPTGGNDQWSYGRGSH
ncbi:P-loop containing nucleoside triphosphate hydrolase protein [Syncephalis plumigaleata]|nr:P-loop containing nucleoside triphosphate hydrolase protein [Syncephalis plumigaleata]